MSEDTKNLQKTITTLKQENALLKSEVEELDEEMTTQRTTGFKCFLLVNLIVIQLLQQGTATNRLKISFMLRK